MGRLADTHRAYAALKIVHLNAPNVGSALHTVLKGMECLEPTPNLTIRFDTSKSHDILNSTDALIAYKTRILVDIAPYSPDTTHNVEIFCRRLYMSINHAQVTTLIFTPRTSLHPAAMHLIMGLQRRLLSLDFFTIPTQTSGAKKAKTESMTLEGLVLSGTSASSSAPPSGLALSLRKYSDLATVKKYVKDGLGVHGLMLLDAESHSKVHYDRLFKQLKAAANSPLLVEHLTLVGFKPLFIFQHVSLEELRTLSLIGCPTSSIFEWLESYRTGTPKLRLQSFAFVDFRQKRDKKGKLVTKLSSSDMDDLLRMLRNFVRGCAKLESFVLSGPFDLIEIKPSDFLGSTRNELKRVCVESSFVSEGAVELMHVVTNCPNLEILGFPMRGMPNYIDSGTQNKPGGLKMGGILAACRQFARAIKPATKLEHIILYIRPFDYVFNDEDFMYTASTFMTELGLTTCSSTIKTVTIAHKEPGHFEGPNPEAKYKHYKVDHGTDKPKEIKKYEMSKEIWQTRCLDEAIWHAVDTLMK